MITLTTATFVFTAEAYGYKNKSSGLATGAFGYRFKSFCRLFIMLLCNILTRRQSVKLCKTCRKIGR